MAETSTQPARQWPKPDKAWLAIIVVLALIAMFDWQQTRPTVEFALAALWRTLPYVVFAVLAVAYMKATGAETLLSRAFEGRETRMIVLAALLGGLSPFCSCQVIPFIAALLAVGAPLSAVMAFWLSSPLMDPSMFAITAGTLGFDFALAKTLVAVGLGLFGGTAVMLFARSAVFADPLKPKPGATCSSGGCGCGTGPVYSGKPVWAFWRDSSRVRVFRATVLENALFLGKWLTLAYLVEALMVNYIPADLIARVLGGDGIFPIILGALVGAPAYLNGFAAVPLIDGLLTQGMSNGAAMSFVVAGGVSSIPAAIAVWALVKPRVFAAYLGLALIGSVVAGIGWNAIA